MTLRLTVAEALAQLLGALGVPAVYGIVGGKMTPVLHALAKAGAPRFIGVRHEASAAMMATAEGMVAPVPAVAMAEQAPGMVNLASGLGTARANNLAVVVITISTPAAISAPPRGAMMEIDASALFAPVTKASWRLTEPRRLPELVRRAFREAASGRPGPVHLDIPADLLGVELVCEPAALTAPPDRIACPAPDPQAVQAAAAMLGAARRPLLVFGGGAVAAAAPARALAERLGAPVLVSQMGLGVLPSDHRLLVGQGGVIGGPQVRRVLEQADVVLAVGCRLSSWFWGQGGLGLAPDARLIQVDIDPGQIGLAAPVALGIQADAGLALAGLLQALPGASAQPSEETATLRAARQDHLGQLVQQGTTKGLHPGQLAQALGQALPDDALVTMDGGHTSFWHNDLLTARAPRRLFHDPGQAQLGFGLPFALALKRAHPDRPVICTTGDGSFGFTLQELDTARRHRLPVIVVIHNNAAWGVIAANQARAGFALETALQGTDYAAIARGFGCCGETVETLDQFRAAFARALTADLPTVLDCRTDWVAHPMLPTFGRTTQAPDPDAPLPW